MNKNIILIIASFLIFQYNPSYAVLTKTMPQQLKPMQKALPKSSEYETQKNNSYNNSLPNSTIGSYMQNIQYKIKSNWEPPQGEEDRNVIVFFSIYKDGSLADIRVSKSSGLQEADWAAVKAIKLSAPFDQLPSEYKEQYMNINFTFDYTIQGAQRY